MRALVIYESIFGNTRRVAEAIADGLRTGFAVDVVERGRAPISFDGIDLVVGGGVQDWLAEVAPNVEAVATFETLIRRRGPFPYGATKTCCRLDRRCLGGVAEPVPFYLMRIGGPLEEGETERARAWGEGLAAAFVAAAYAS